MQEEEGLISGARTQEKQVEEDNYPDVDEAFSFQNFEKYILNATENFKEVFNIIKKGETNDLQIRFSIWRYILNVVPVQEDVANLKSLIEKQRNEYSANIEKFKFKQGQKPQKAKETKPKTAFNPLAPAPKKQQAPENSPWNGYFEDNHLKNEIKKDVERTYQDRDFFMNLKIKGILSNVLYVWSKLNPEISYRQGMNELVASLIVIYFQEALEVKKPRPENVSEELYENANFLINLKYAEADIYHVFNKVMENGQMQMFVHKEDKSLKANSKINTPILARLAKITDYFLKIIDIDLFRHLKLLEVQFSTFLVKWVRCIFTREFPMQQTFCIWDSIFMDAYLFPYQKLENLTNLNRDNYEISNFLMIDCFAIGMFVRLREEVMAIDDGSECMKGYINYESVDNIKELIDFAFEIKQRILTYNPEEEGMMAQKKQFTVFNPKGQQQNQARQQQQQQQQSISNKNNPLQSAAIKKAPQNKPQLFEKNDNQVVASDSESPVKPPSNLGSTNDMSQQKEEVFVITSDKHSNLNKKNNNNSGNNNNSLSGSNIKENSKQNSSNNLLNPQPTQQSQKNNNNNITIQPVQKPKPKVVFTGIEFSEKDAKEAQSHIQAALEFLKKQQESQDEQSESSNNEQLEGIIKNLENVNTLYLNKLPKEQAQQEQQPEVQQSRVIKF